MSAFQVADKITDFDILEESNCCPPGFIFAKNENFVVIYRTVLDPKTFMASTKECIRIDQDLHVQLEYEGIHIPLPQWFIHGHNAKLTKFSMLENFPSYMKNTANEKHPSSILEELRKRQYYKLRGRPPFSSDLIRYSLLL